MLSILFIGNSFTARNDLPGLLVRMAEARGIKIEHRLISVGGASLRTHWNKGEAPDAIRRGRYDYVVLQEQSTLPVKNAARMKENVRLFDEVIRAAGATTALYMTWARRDTPEAQRAITDAYASVGLELGATVVPVGVAWQKVLRRPAHPVLHDKDGSHPTPAGTFLAACVFLATLSAQSPIGLTIGVEGLPDRDLDLLRRTAAEVTRSRATR